MLRVNRPHLSELNEPVSLDLSVRSSVKEDCRSRAGNWDRRRNWPGAWTPLIRPMRNSAEAIVAPVLPAAIIAPARPSRTASAARTSVESFLRAHTSRRVIMHADDFARLDQLEYGAVNGLAAAEIRWPHE